MPSVEYKNIGKCYQAKYREINFKQKGAPISYP